MPSSLSNYVTNWNFHGFLLCPLVQEKETLFASLWFIWDMFLLHKFSMGQEILELEENSKFYRNYHCSLHIYMWTLFHL